MTERAVILKVTPFRRRAREWEREAQQFLTGRRNPDAIEPDILAGLLANPWVKGVRVQKAGLFSHAVVGTATRGH
jgi:hypothetical protein